MRYRKSEFKKFECLTTDNENALINSFKKYFPGSNRIACWFHMKNNLEKRASTMGLKKANFIKETEDLIASIGIIPLIYNGDIT